MYMYAWLNEPDHWVMMENDELLSIRLLQGSLQFAPIRHITPVLSSPELINNIEMDLKIKINSVIVLIEWFASCFDFRLLTMFYCSISYVKLFSFFFSSTIKINLFQFNPRKFSYFGILKLKISKISIV